MFLVNEALRNYENEKEWLNTPFNQTIAYLPGKGITENEFGQTAFYFLDNISDFVYGQDIEKEFLFPTYMLEQPETEQLSKITAANTYLHTVGLHAVYLRYEQKKPILFILSPKEPAQFYKLPYEAHTSFTAAAALPAIKENTIETAGQLEVTL